MNFDRYKSAYETTWGFQCFRRHHRELNAMYWAFVPTWWYCHYKAKHAAIDEKPSVLFHASGDDVRRLDADMRIFTTHHDKLANWVRLSALVSALSYLEIYINKTVSMGLLSDPAARLRKPKAIDGTEWLKLGLFEDNKKLIERCTKGTFRERVNSIESIFPNSCGTVTTDEIRALDSVRILRNDIGHSYGRRGDINQCYFADYPAKKAREENLKKWLKLIYDFAKKIDTALLESHIGAFELVYFYHTWRSTISPADSLNEARALRKAVKPIFGNGPDKAYFAGLIDYYRGL